MADLPALKGKSTATAVILCGEIASGKTTYARRLRETRGAVVLSVDDLMLRLYSACPGERTHVRTAEEIALFFCGLAKQITENGADAVLDFGFWTVAERAAVRRELKRLGVRSELHYLSVPEEARLKRLARRNERLAESGGPGYRIEDELREWLDAKFEEPDESEIDVRVSPEA